MVDIYNTHLPLRILVRSYQVWRATGVKGLTRSVKGAILWPGFKKILSANIRCRVNDYVLYLNTRDQGISRELFMYGVHEPITTELIRQNLKIGMSVLDVGANIGYYVVLEGKIVRPSGKVIAIEPYPLSIQILKRNIEANELDRVVTIIEMAVGDSEGYVGFQVSKRANWNRVTRLGDRNSIRVKVGTLDSISSMEHIDFIRMDIEGYEIEALRGTQKVIEQSKPLICIELHPHLRDPGEMKDMLINLRDVGYYVKYGYYRKMDLLGVGTLNDIQYVDFSWLIEDNGPIVKRIPYTVWMEAEEKDNNKIVYSQQQLQAKD